MAPAPIDDTVTSTPSTAPAMMVAAASLLPCNCFSGCALIQASMRPLKISATTVSSTEAAIE